MWLTASFLLSLQAEVVEKIVGLREGIPRKDAKEVKCFRLIHVFLLM